MKYNFQKIEKKWQKLWQEKKVFKASEKSKKPKYYQLETFPYPSAAGLHVGHPKGYIAEDIHARYMRMKGHNVLYTMGWDAFGLPTENYAIKVGKSPQEVAAANIKNFKRQVQMFGLSYDWDREINTSSPEYYKWTQWLFLQLYKKGLAYRKKAKVNWCPKDQTVLANEQVVSGRCERDGELVVQKEMEQWFFKITDYAERLIEGLNPVRSSPTQGPSGARSRAGTTSNGVNWPEPTIKRQLDWIGKSEGAMIKFKATSDERQENQNSSISHVAHAPVADIEVFTTRPDTLFGATYLVLAPEHPLLATSDKRQGTRIQNWKDVERYIRTASHKTELMRQEQAREKTGVELKGIKVINPATKEEIPIWVADYVLGSYGTGAIMAVPAHDERDWEFAKKYKLPIRMVVCPHYPAKTCPVLDHAYTGDGHLVDSGKFNGLPAEKAKWEITKAVGGERKVQYKLRDWSVSRQRYWGVPIPIIYCHKCLEISNLKSQISNKSQIRNSKLQTATIDGKEYAINPVPEKDLPVELPDLKDYRPKGLPPLASSKKFMAVKCPKCKSDAKRDPETLDTFVDSSWYYLAYAMQGISNYSRSKDRGSATKSGQFPISNYKEIINYWMPVDLYVIGAEHTVLHLLYSRFITKFLHDEGYLKFDEPFLQLEHVGLILGADGQKMSKSKGNVVNPDKLIKEFGADAVRLYEMFMGPFGDGQPWDPKGVVGAERFLKRFYDYVQKVISSSGKTSESQKTAIHKAIKKVGEDIKNFKFNTAISALMILLNELENTPIAEKDAEAVIKIINPFAPHLANELWAQLGKKTLLDEEEWPAFDSKLLESETVELIVQVDGKFRGRISVSKGIPQKEAEKAASQNPDAAKWLTGKEIKRVVFVPDRLINFCLK